ncbi:MAG TPA: alpha/beta hydrolase, partial [Acidimicrobiia bacterium]|nr:alpha/beta hydrolase [Acidimicrobiia bacterium]
MSQYLDLDSGPVHWKDYGGSGSFVVMVHGLGGSIATWDAIGTNLAKSYRVTALDLPGFGLSPPARDWTLETHRDAVAGFIRACGNTPAILCGNSMGGLVAEMVASRYPDIVSALVLVSPATPPSLADPQINWPMAIRLLLGATPGLGLLLSRQAIGSMSSRDLVNDLLARITHKPDRIAPDLVESFVEIAETRRALPWSVE